MCVSSLTFKIYLNFYVCVSDKKVLLIPNSDGHISS